SRTETDDGVAVGRNALVETAEGGKYQPLRVDGALRTRVHWFPPAWLSIRGRILHAARPAISRLRPLHRPNVHLRRQRAMDRTFVGDLQESPALLRIERAAQCDGPLDTVDHSFLGFAFLAIGGVDTGVAEFDRYPLERQRLALGVESK